MDTDQRGICDCAASGHLDKPKQHGADPHAKNCAYYTRRGGGGLDHTDAEIAGLFQGLHAVFSTVAGTDARGRQRLIITPDHPTEHLPHERPGIARTAHTFLDLDGHHGGDAAADVEVAHIPSSISGYTLARLWRLTGGAPTCEIRPGSGEWRDVKPHELPAIWLAVAARVAALPWVELGAVCDTEAGAPTDADPRRRFSRRMQFNSGPQQATFYACPTHRADLEAGRVPCFRPIPGEGVQDRGTDTEETCDLCREQ